MSRTERKRASMFDQPAQEATDSPESAPERRKLDLGRFTPKAPPPVDQEALRRVSAEQGFTTSHAEPPPPKRDGRRLKKTGRTAQFNVRLKPETVDRFWAATEAAGLTYADDMLQKLLELYEGQGDQ